MELKGSVLQWPADRPRVSRLIFFVLGVLYTSTFAPIGLSLLMPIVLIPVLYVCLTVSPRDAYGHIFWFGFGLFLSGTYWIYISVVIFGEAPAWVALILMIGLVLIMSLWLGLTGWLINNLSHGEPARLLWVAPAAWVAIEWLRGWVLTGFPWLAAGYSQIDLPMAGFAPVFGVYGVSFAMLFSVAAVIFALMSKDALRITGAGLALLPWVLGGLLCLVSWTEPSGQAIRATILQAGISQDRKWDIDQLVPTMSYYRNATAREASSSLVVWPEVAIPTRSSQQQELQQFIRIMQSDTAERGQSVAFGVLEFRSDRGETRVYNSVAMLSGGNDVSFYQKRHLVPFGEYFPVPASVREWMKMMSLPHTDLQAGEAVQPLLETGDGLKVATAICYEDAYGAEQLYAFPEAELIVNVSNDAWFGDSIAPHQHLEIARMRSLEVGRPTIRSTNTGVSAFIDAEGEIVGNTGPQFRQARLTQMVQPHSGSTPYVGWGNWPIIGLSVLLLGFFWFRSRASL
ncbi:MAG: apolipoprotein N-acyltransferase [Woeseiaceae bacterium]|nr:apolipoprotein N-acyltransferase [Woeseiaceae bacterium]